MTESLVRDHHTEPFPGDTVDSPAAEAARRRLREAVAALWPQAPACASDPDGWYAGGADAHRSSAQRVAAAIAACGPCPIRTRCAEAGKHERWGVWAGDDRGAPRREHRQVTEPGRPRHPGTRQRPYRVRRGRPLPVPCAHCGAGAAEPCMVKAGTPAERNHAVRQRSAATEAAA